MPLGYYPGCSGEGSGIEYKMSTEKTAEMLGIELKNWKTGIAVELPQPITPSSYWPWLCRLGTWPLRSKWN